MAVLVIVAVIITGTVYHNGMRNYCPFCILGASYLDKVNEDDSCSIEKSRVYSRLFSHELARVLHNIEREVASRAPPV